MEVAYCTGVVAHSVVFSHGTPCCRIMLVLRWGKLLSWPPEGVSLLSRQQDLPRALLPVGLAPSDLTLFLLQPKNVPFQNPVRLASLQILLLLCLHTVVLFG